ncbi:MAG: hypothetical protein ACFHWX_21355 [Bacteroidota bacterium]
MKLYRYFRWLSLDIVLGAIIFLRFFEDLYQETIPFTVYIALASAIWLIYTVDHLIDTKKSTELDSRRQFHLRHFKSLIFVSGIIAIIGLVNIYYLPEAVIRSGVILSAFCVAYLMLVFFIPKLWFKEILVAVGYASGIFLAPLTFKQIVTTQDIILFVQLVGLAMSNLLIFSYYDREQDQKSGFGSMILQIDSHSRRLISVLLYKLLGSVFFSLAFLHGKYQTVELVYLIMTVILLLLIRYDLYFSSKERFRMVGDAIFFVPVLFMIL